MLELAVVILAIFIGVRMGGIGLGLMGAAGVGILCFGFGLQPTTPPVEVILIITAVITAIAAMESAGGLDYLVFLAEKILRKHPKYINYLGPAVTYVFTAFAGTGHVSYSLLPIIAEVSTQVGIRPARPLAVSTLASHLGISASPISAATVLLLGLLSPQGVTLVTILAITIPATFIGLMIAAFVNSIRPMKALSDALPTANTQIESQKKDTGATQFKQARRAVWLFGLAITVIIACAAFSNLRPSWNHANGSITRLDMTTLIEIVMLSISALMVWLCRLNIDKIVQQKTFSAGIKAVIAIFGIAWLGDTYFSAHMASISFYLSQWVTSMPWLFGLALFFMSAMLFSQAATVRAILPLGISLGLPVPILIGLYPAVNGLFFIPGYPIELAAINFDSTGSTRIGKFVFNHSFMIPGLVGIFSAVMIGLISARFFY